MAVPAVRAQADAERKTAQTAAAARCGAVHAGVPPKRSRQHKVAATAALRQGLAVQLAAEEAAEYGEPVQGKPVRLPLSRQQAKLAVTAEQEQERYLATATQAAGQQAHGVLVLGKASARQGQHNLAGRAVHKRVRLPAHGALVADKTVLRQANPQQAKPAATVTREHAQEA